MGYVYILKSLKNGRLYVGSTNSLDRRLKEHFKGGSVYTRNLRPLELVFKQKFADLEQARKIERKLKRFKSKVILEKIIRDGFMNAAVVQR